MGTTGCKSAAQQQLRHSCDKVIQDQPSSALHNQSVPTQALCVLHMHVLHIPASCCAPKAKARSCRRLLLHAP